MFCRLWMAGFSSVADGWPLVASHFCSLSSGLCPCFARGLRCWLAAFCLVTSAALVHFAPVAGWVCPAALDAVPCAGVAFCIVLMRRLLVGSAGGLAAAWCLLCCILKALRWVALSCYLCAWRLYRGAVGGLAFAFRLLRSLVHCYV